MPWRIVAAPFMFIGIFFFYLTLGDKSYSTYIIPFIGIIVILYVFSPQINWWWYIRHPPALAKGLVQFFEKHYPIYQKMSVKNKQLFQDRVALHMIASDYIPKVTESVQEDIKAITAACATQIALGKEDFMFPKFEHIVVYPKAFLSPQYPKKFHASEVYDHEGVLTFSAEHLVRGFTEPDKYYNIGLHEYAKVFMYSHPTEAWPTLDENIWEDLYEISKFTKEAISTFMNIDNIEPLPVSICHFFVFPEAFKKQLPKLYKLYIGIFNQMP